MPPNLRNGSAAAFPSALSMIMLPSGARRKVNPAPVRSPNELGLLRIRHLGPCFVTVVAIAASGSIPHRNLVIPPICPGLADA